MRKAGGEDEAGDEKGSDGGGGVVGVRVGDVGEHGLVEQRVGEAEDAARNDRRPEGCLAIGGEGEPEERDGEEPDAGERGEEARFRPVAA